MNHGDTESTENNKTRAVLRVLSHLLWVFSVSSVSPWLKLLDLLYSRQPSANELAIARFQGKHVAMLAGQLTRGRG